MDGGMTLNANTRLIRYRLMLGKDLVLCHVMQIEQADFRSTLSVPSQTFELMAILSPTKNNSNRLISVTKYRARSHDVCFSVCRQIDHTYVD